VQLSATPCKTPKIRLKIADPCGHGGSTPTGTNLMLQLCNPFLPLPRPGEICRGAARDIFARIEQRVFEPGHLMPDSAFDVVRYRVGWSPADHKPLGPEVEGGRERFSTLERGGCNMSVEFGQRSPDQDMEMGRGAVWLEPLAEAVPGAQAAVTPATKEAAR